ncbi:hypothetical protein HYPSUDRAFT_793178 [Hypholoma sublateritium FD-334 SS-4]|uniref:Uncharacterized protein n=1 Tax=Hypholoma sublateritium (strain FD-334 SS-4) TaxID=945553 RepID=A0A0D2LJV2_HYPSF|nr:hypothetical protein HYPSUDRAFT_793178 [Hypholoma sublateritium FD-334 SS-4]
MEQILPLSSAVLLSDCDIESQLVSPISRLPPELLGSIFILAKMAEVECNHLWSYTEFRRWIYIGHVSSHWRNLVFTLPILWDNSPPLALLHWVEEILKRSPDMLSRLSINVDLDCTRSIAGLKALLKYCPRIKHLHLMNMEREHQDVLELFQLPTFTAEMETLCISRPIEQTFIPDGLLTNAVNFCRLELANCQVNWSQCILPNLTCLKLHDIGEYIELTFSQFMGLLGRAIKLQSLELKAALPLEFGQDESTNQVELEAISSVRIVFHYLHNLVLSCTARQASKFFRCFQFPSAVAVDVNLKRFSNMQTVPDLSKTLMSIAASGMYSSTETAAQTLAIQEVHYGWQLMLFAEALGGGNSDTITLYQDAARFMLRLYWEPLHTTDFDEGLLTFFNSGFPLQQVSHVYLLSSPSGIRSTTLANTIGKLPAVSFLKTEAHMAVPVLHALNSGGRGCSSTGILFPRLQSIHLEDVAFEYPDYHYRVHADGYILMRVEMLQDCLVRRRQYGAPISKLTLYDCDNLTGNDVAKLRGVVADIDWSEDPDWEQDTDQSLSDGSYTGSNEDEDDQSSDSGSDSDLSPRHPEDQGPKND